MRRPRHNHSPQFKAKVALAALHGDETLTELAELVPRGTQPDHAVAPAGREIARKAGSECRFQVRLEPLIQTH